MPKQRILIALAMLYFAPFFVLWPVLFSQPAAATESAPYAIDLVADDEPGEPLVITGRLFAADGETPLADTEIYVYHTDINGYYSGNTTRSDNPRIHGTLTTDADGRYEIRTIRPGPYPAAGVPAHVHYVVRAEGHIEQRFELRFEGDPLLSARHVEASRQAGRFGRIKALDRDSQGILRCVHDLRLAP